MIYLYKDKKKKFFLKEYSTTKKNLIWTYFILITYTTNISHESNYTIIHAIHKTCAKKINNNNNLYRKIWMMHVQQFEIMPYLFCRFYRNHKCLIRCKIAKVYEYNCLLMTIVTYDNILNDVYISHTTFSHKEFY